jgi:hypothetical protein
MVAAGGDGGRLAGVNGGGRRRWMVAGGGRWSQMAAKKHKTKTAAKQQDQQRVPAGEGLRIGLRVELAAKLGLTPQSITRYLSREDWPVRREPPWTQLDLEVIRKWREGLQEDRSADAPADLKNVGRLLKQEQLIFTRVKREQLQGKLVEKDLLERALVGLAQCFVQQLEELQSALPLTLAGKDPGQIEKIVKDRFHACRNRLAEQRMIEMQLVDESVKSQKKPKGRGKRKPRA